MENWTTLHEHYLFEIGKKKKEIEILEEKATKALMQICSQEPKKLASKIGLSIGKVIEDKYLPDSMKGLKLRFVNVEIDPDPNEPLNLNLVRKKLVFQELSDLGRALPNKLIKVNIQHIKI